jgi:hypothetical protein
MGVGLPDRSFGAGLFFKKNPRMKVTPKAQTSGRDGGAREDDEVTENEAAQHAAGLATLLTLYSSKLVPAATAVATTLSSVARAAASIVRLRDQRQTLSKAPVSYFVPLVQAEEVQISQEILQDLDDVALWKPKCEILRSRILHEMWKEEELRWTTLDRKAYVPAKSGAEQNLDLNLSVTHADALIHAKPPSSRSPSTKLHLSALQV